MAPSETFLRLKQLAAGKRPPPPPLPLPPPLPPPPPSPGRYTTGKQSVEVADSGGGGDSTVEESLPLLPSCADLERAFGLFQPAGGCAPEVDGQGQVTCACAGCARWKAYTAGRLGAPWPAWPQYEVLTREHVASLAAYLRARAAHHHHRLRRPL
eukprot:CAMPEP_0197589410 /NCGR_PEP_ID=MMETSP1326-20131121/10371_1 /TAXON_ID=1155430 /ORGANISM="Genus nov. species nov., Strain RCC2288" /LENGTH=154 /DNA_ID=CAMNT_0043154343 /DNA_START=161 /DNA_END=621 /DNA_ORIENTATION=+